MEKQPPHWTRTRPTETGYYWYREDKPVVRTVFHLGRRQEQSFPFVLMRVEILPKNSSTGMLDDWTDWLDCFSGEWWSERIAEPL